MELKQIPYILEYQLVLPHNTTMIGLCITLVCYTQESLQVTILHIIFA